MKSDKIVLGLFAHPDDAEFTCAGTLALLRDKGWGVHIATVSNGDGGSVDRGPEEIARIRKAEAAKAAKLLGGEYTCLESHDIFILYDEPSIRKTIKLVRQVRPTVVITASPRDYMVDHEMSSKLAKTACFAAGVCNVKTEGVEAYFHIPHLYYVNAIESKDEFGRPMLPSIAVDITEKIEIKEKMLCCHESQREWLKQHNKVDEYIIAMRKRSQQQGQAIGVEYAEGFRQHLGHGYPQDNILKAELGNLVREL